MGPALTESSLTSRISHRDTKGQGGGTMAPMILSDDLYGELEDLVLHTPLAKERCRARALLWLAEGLPAEQIADGSDPKESVPWSGVSLLPHAR